MVLRMVPTILSPLVVTAHANVGGWADFGAFGACGTCVESVTQNRDNPAHLRLDPAFITLRFASYTLDAATLLMSTHYSKDDR